MEEEKKEEKRLNPSIEAFKKNIGREVTVVVGTQKGLERITGVCEAFEFLHKTIVIRNEKNTYTIPHYLWIERPRPKTEE